MKKRWKRFFFFFSTIPTSLHKGLSTCCSTLKHCSNAGSKTGSGQEVHTNDGQPLRCQPWQHPGQRLPPASTSPWHSTGAPGRSGRSHPRPRQNATGGSYLSPSSPSLKSQLTFHSSCTLHHTLNCAAQSSFAGVRMDALFYDKRV